MQYAVRRNNLSKFSNRSGSNSTSPISSTLAKAAISLSLSTHHFPGWFQTEQLWSVPPKGVRY
ncbi:hypothetical protein T10_6397 [Trichinella papuae]|uniref:Uncharacterized protein n=1 Tax=Trichinella papuae TaxID=268474 RepID=A0A0V1MJ86_9BILA|nr:hypothetical protein T10_6397 [Trichinella papuae]